MRGRSWPPRAPEGGHTGHLDDASGLLAAPRGRRLCLEVAFASDERLWAPVLDAARAFGSPGTRFSSFGHGVPRRPPAPTPVAEVARAVAGLDASALAAVLADDTRMLACLERTVGTAAYWQPPYPEDLLVATPELCAALAPVAQAIEAAGLLARWAAPAATRQWRVEFDVDATDASWPGNPASALAGWRERRVEAEQRASAWQRRHPRKPLSDVWWSCPLDAPLTSGAFAGVPCGLALVEDEFGWERALVTETAGAGRVLELDRERWAELCRRFPLEVTETSRAVWGWTTGREGAWVIPDWAAVAGEWDAVHLSIAQYLLLAGDVIEVDDERASLVAGWGPDATVWLADRVRAWAAPERWVRADSGTSGEPWVRVPPQD